MKDKIISLNFLITVVSIVYGGSVLFYAATLYESRMRFGIIFLSLSIIMVVLFGLQSGKFYFVGKKLNYWIAGFFVTSSW